MRRELSSRATFLYKFIVPALWIGFFGGATTLLFAAPGGLRDDPGVAQIRWAFLALFTIVTPILYWLLVGLKTVALLDQSLEISNFSRSLRVPLRDVERVSGSVIVNPRVIWLDFRRPTEFGSRVVFMPPLRIFAGFRRDPLVEELRVLIARAATHA